MDTDETTAIEAPPEHLRMRVSLVSDPAQFDELGRHAIVDLKRALAGIGRPLNSFCTLLDWGCGPGGTVKHLPGHFGGEIHACDIDREAVAWVEANLPFVRATASDEWPPLPYADGQFDLVINHSVLTHLDEAHQDAWLTELRRVLAPQGILVLTVHGLFSQDFWAEHLPRDEAGREERIATMYREVDRRGIYFMQDDVWAADFPAYYQNTFHSPWYVFEHWSRFLEIAAYIPRGSLSLQDMVVLRHKRGEVPERTVPRATARAPA